MFISKCCVFAVLLCLLSFTSTFPLGEDAASESNPVSLFLKETSEKNSRQLPQSSFISRSNSFLDDEGNLNVDESQRASIHRAIPENVPTAFVHTSLGNFRSGSNTLNQDSLHAQKRHQPSFYQTQDAIDNFPQNPQNSDSFVAPKTQNIVHHAPQYSIDNFNNNPPSYPEQIYEQGEPNFGLKDEDILEGNNFVLHQSPSQEGFSHVNTNDNLEFDDTQYIIDNEGAQPDETDFSTTHIPQQDNFQYFHQFSGNPQGQNHISPVSTDDTLLNNHNLQTHSNDQNKFVNIISQPYAGHIVNQHSEPQHLRHTKRKNIGEPSHPNALFSQNSLQFASPSIKDKEPQLGQTYIQRLEPTLILSNIPPYKVESKQVPFTLLPFESQHTGSVFKQSPEGHGVIPHKSLEQTLPHEHTNSASSVENVILEENDNQFDSQNIDNSNIYNENSDNQQFKAVEFLPSYLGQNLAEEESQIVPQGRSLKNYEPSQFTHRTGFNPGILEGGFVPSRFFS